MPILAAVISRIRLTSAAVFMLVAPATLLYSVRTGESDVTPTMSFRSCSTGPNTASYADDFPWETQQIRSSP